MVSAVDVFASLGIKPPSHIADLVVDEVALEQQQKEYAIQREIAVKQAFLPWKQLNVASAFDALMILPSRYVDASPKVKLDDVRSVAFYDPNSKGAPIVIKGRLSGELTEVTKTKGTAINGKLRLDTGVISFSVYKNKRVSIEYLNSLEFIILEGFVKFLDRPVEFGNGGFAGRLWFTGSPVDSKDLNLVYPVYAHNIPSAEVRKILSTMVSDPMIVEGFCDDLINRFPCVQQIITIDKLPLALVNLHKPENMRWGERALEVFTQISELVKAEICEI